MAEDVTGGSTAQFQEVLELRVDLDLFKQEMGKVAEVYSSSLQGLGSVTLGTSDVIVALKSLESQFERLSEGATKSVTDLTSVMLETANRVEEALNTLNGKTATTVPVQAGATPEASPENRGAQAALSQAEQWVLKRSKIRQQQEDEDAAANEKSVRALSQYQDAKQASDEKIGRLHASVLDQMAADEQAVNSKSLRALAQYEEQKRASDERIGRLHAQVLEQQAEQEQSVRDKSAKAYAQYSEQQQATEERVGRLHAQVLEQQAAAEQSVRERTAKAYAQYDAQRRNLASQVPKESLPADFFNNQPLERMRAQISQIKDEAKDAAKATQGIFGTASLEKFLASLRNIPDMIANVLALNLAWKAAGLVITGVAEAIALPFKAVQEGVQYVRDLQTATADLQGTIAGNITLSRDYATNFKLAGDAAEVVRQKLQDVALTTGLTVQGLQSAFKQLAEGGGGSFVTNIDQLVVLTQMFGQAMKAAGKDVNATRTLLSEIPALLAGNAAPASKLLEVLHLTKDQWEVIRLSALQHHDLVAQLAPLLKPYLEVADQAGSRQEVLLSQLELMKQRIEATFSQGVFNAYTDALQTAKGFLQDQEGSLTAMGQIFADLIQAAIEFGTELAKVGADEALKGLAQLLNLMVFSVKLILQGFVELAQLLYSMKDFDLSKPLQSVEQIGMRIKAVLDQAGQKFADDLDRAAANAGDIDQNTTRYRDQVDQQIHNRNKIPAAAQGQVVPGISSSQVTAGQSPTTEFPAYDSLLKNLATTTQIIDSSKPEQQKQRNAAMQLLRDELTQRIDLIKEESQEELDAVNRLEHLKDVSAEEASKRRIGILDAQLVQIADAADAVLAKAQKSGLNKEQLTAFVTLVDKINSAANRTAGKSITGEEDKRYDVQYKDFEDYLNREQQAYDAHQKALELIDQTLLSEKLKTNEEVVQNSINAENQIQQMALKTLDVKIALAGADVDTVTKLTQQKEVLEAAYADKAIEQSTRLREARQKDRDAEFEYEIQRQELLVAQRQGHLQIAVAENRVSTHEVAKENVGIADAQNNVAQAELSKAQLDYAQVLANASIQAAQNGTAVDLNSEAVRNAKQKVDQLAVAADGAAQALHSAKENANPFASTLEGLFGTGKDTLGKAFGGGSFGSILQNVGTSIQSAVGVLGKGISAIQQGVANGGVLGGIGAGLQSFGGLVPVAGPFIQAAGSIMGLIGGLFTAQAKHIADEIKKNVDQTLKDINSGVDTSAQGLAQLESQRQDAINRLSGKKGGKKQLDQLLPGIDDAITQLKKQIADVKKGFEDALSSLKASAGHSSVFTQWISDWQNINKQVKDYIDAVGAAGYKNAQAFLTLNLAAERLKLQGQYRQGEEQAIQDALSLNDLLKQRNDLEQSYAEQVFGIQSRDSIQRRESSGLQTAFQLAQAKKQYEDQKSSLDYQIAQTQEKVTVERQVFKIASDTASLQRQSLADQLLDLQEMKQQYLDIQSILAKTATLIAGPKGSFFGNPLLPGVAPIPGFGTSNPPTHPVTIGTIIVNGRNPKEIVDGLQNELGRRFRYGYAAY